MFELVSILACCNSLIASRYHVVVTSMTGLVPSAGVSMDERIRNLMRERGHSHLIVDVRDPELEPKLLNILRCLHQDRVAVSEHIGRTVLKLKSDATHGCFTQTSRSRPASSGSCP